LPIVTGYEDTPGGHDALVLGAQLARLTGLEAVVATVYPEDGRGFSAVARDPRWRQKVQKVARERFARAREFIGEGWGPVEPEFAALGPGLASIVLNEYADEVGAAVLVVGSTGHGLLGRIAPGRTVQRLLPTARCPVAIAPRGYRHIGTRGMTVVSVAYDGSAAADRAAAVAVHLASRTGAALRFVTAEAAHNRGHGFSKQQGPVPLHPPGEPAMGLPDRRGDDAARRNAGDRRLGTRSRAQRGSAFPGVDHVRAAVE
jgi:nucleotide-binding universal stress UspA family protein